MLVCEYSCTFSGSKQVTRKGTKPAFRPAYGKLSNLRAVVGHTVPVICLTATATLATIEKIKINLGLSLDIPTINIPPCKENIKYIVLTTKAPGDEVSISNYIKHHSTLLIPENISIKLTLDSILYHWLSCLFQIECFQWLADILKVERQDAPRMLVFYRRINFLSETYGFLHDELGELGYVDYQKGGTNDDRNRIFDMYHLKTHDTVKQSTITDLVKPEGKKRTTLCSTSFSMGLSLSGVKVTVHYGPADDLDDYMQETGRGARETGSSSLAVLIKYRNSTGSCHVSKDMKEYITTKECRRKILYRPFMKDEPKSVKPGHNCCDNCSLKCDCGDCPSDSLVSKIKACLDAPRYPTICEGESDSSSADSDSDSDIDIARHRRPVVIFSDSEED